MAEGKVGMDRIDAEIFRVGRDPKQMNVLALAYIGDSVYEVYIRQYLLARGEIKPHLLHQAATRYVSAKAQADQLEKIWGILDEEEQGIVRRGRNAKAGSMPKNASPADYHKATAFEALIGYHYLMGHRERLLEIIMLALEEKTNLQ
jgi:ribonuclease-3 family protein